MATIQPDIDNSSLMLSYQVILGHIKLKIENKNRTSLIFIKNEDL